MGRYFRKRGKRGYRAPDQEPPFHKITSFELPCPEGWNGIVSKPTQYKSTVYKGELFFRKAKPGDKKCFVDYRGYIPSASDDYSCGVLLYTMYTLDLVPD